MAAMPEPPTNNGLYGFLGMVATGFFTYLGIKNRPRVKRVTVHTVIDKLNEMQTERTGQMSDVVKRLDKIDTGIQRAHERIDEHLRDHARSING